MDHSVNKVERDVRFPQRFGKFGDDGSDVCVRFTQFVFDVHEIVKALLSDKHLEKSCAQRVYVRFLAVGRVWVVELRSHVVLSATTNVNHTVLSFRVCLSHTEVSQFVHTFPIDFHIQYVHCLDVEVDDIECVTVRHRCAHVLNHCPGLLLLVATILADEYIVVHITLTYLHEHKYPNVRKASVELLDVEQVLEFDNVVVILYLSQRYTLLEQHLHCILKTETLITQITEVGYLARHPLWQILEQS